jgi:hypothetical protein
MNMERIGKAEIDSLVQVEEWPAISIYMPVSRIGDPQDPLRYKNFLNQVESRLVDEGMRTTEARNLLEPEYDLVQDTGYWKQLGADGLAVFRTGERVQRYSLPVSFKELIMVGRRFHVRPLLPLLAGGRYLVLALSRKNLQLFQGDRYQFEEIDLPDDTPKTMTDALQYEPEQQLQYHTKTGSVTGRRAAMFHGHGAGVDDQNENLERYFQIVDRTLFPLLEDTKCPVVLVGTEELHPVYRRVTRSRAILSGGIAGNVSEFSPDVLQRKAWDIALDYYLQEERDAVRTFQDNLNGDRVVGDLQKVLTAAFDGRVEDLFVAEDELVWGLFHPELRQVIVKEKVEGTVVELLDEAVFWTLTKNGTVYIRKREEMPVDTIICARLRY